MFTHSSIAKPNNPESNRRLISWLAELNEHINKSMAAQEAGAAEEVPNPFQPDFQIQNRQGLINAKAYLEKAIVELLAANDCAHQCQKLWPTGQNVLQKLILGIELFSKAYRLQIQVREILMQPDPVPRQLKRLEQLMAEGRKNAERGDSLFMESISQIEQATGYHFVWETHADDEPPI